MLSKAHFTNILLYPTPHSLGVEVVIATWIRLQDTLWHYVSDNKLAASNNVFEELTFDYGI